MDLNKLKYCLTNINFLNYHNSFLYLPKAVKSRKNLAFFRIYCILKPIKNF